MGDRRWRRGWARRRPRSIREAVLRGGAVLLTVVAVPAVAVSAVAVASASPDAAGAATGAAPDAAGTVWLCRPGTAPDPCAAPLDATVVPARGPRTLLYPADADDSPFDCFYVYPTVSGQPSDNADLRVQRAEVDVAAAQAAPFSQACRVWAPMYRQRTLRSLAKGLGSDPSADRVAEASLLAGWKDYLAHFNHGRPVVFIGHSQGAAMLIELLESQIDDRPALRARVVSAILAGGNVTVPAGKVLGATFRHLPLCTSGGQTGCVIAYSTFPGMPPRDGAVGRPGQGVSLQSGQRRRTGVQVACVNPAALGGGSATLEPWLVRATASPPPPPVSTPWVVYPDLYTATCHHDSGAGWLQVAPVGLPGDRRPTVVESAGPAWGYHAQDINLATGDLVDDVQAQERAYSASHP